MQDLRSALQTAHEPHGEPIPGSHSATTPPEEESRWLVRETEWSRHDNCGQHAFRCRARLCKSQAGETEPRRPPTAASNTREFSRTKKQQTPFEFSLRIRLP